MERKRIEKLERVCDIFSLNTEQYKYHVKTDLSISQYCLWEWKG